METIVKPIIEYLKKFNVVFPIIIITYNDIFYGDNYFSAPIIKKFENLTDLQNNILPSDFANLFYNVNNLNHYRMNNDLDYTEIYNKFKNDNLHQDPFIILQNVEKNLKFDYHQFKIFYGSGAEQVLNFLDSMS